MQARSSVISLAARTRCLRQSNPENNIVTPGQQDDCSGYILGVFDQMVLLHLICPRSNPSGLTAQAVAVALRSLNDHPEKWDQPPAFLIGESFKAAFPCGG
jgi:hypothetical protein